MGKHIENSKIESYSRALTEKISNEYYNSSESLSGEQILKLTSLEQVNLFVIKNLFDKWKEESAKLKSPYFSYENKEVKEALGNLLNKLSQNISIKKEFLKPLLEKGIYDSLILILNPHEFFKNEFLSKKYLKISELKETEKYLRINKELFQAFIKGLEQENKNEFFIEEGLNLFDKIYEASSVESPDKYIELFNSILKLEFTELPEIPYVELKSEEHKESKSASTILNEKFSKEQLTLNDLMKVSNATLVDKISKSRIQNIKDAISLNQKFLFVNNLFSGANNEFERALEDIDKCANINDALNMLSGNYAGKFNWDYSQEPVKEFLEILERKFN
jgi:hypothetical protein